MHFCRTIDKSIEEIMQSQSAFAGMIPWRAAQAVSGCKVCLCRNFARYLDAFNYAQIPRATVQDYSAQLQCRSQVSTLALCPSLSVESCHFGNFPLPYWYAYKDNRSSRTSSRGASENEVYDNHMFVGH